MREWLKEKRTEKGLTSAQMAERLEITESYYSYIESGVRQKKMDLSLALKLSAILAIPIEQIVSLEAAP